MCEIVVAGWGISNYRMYDALNKGSLLLMCENNTDNTKKTCVNNKDELYNINQCELLPTLKLVENEDFISFNLDNLKDKLDYIINNSDLIKKIRQNGHNKFIKSINMNKLSELLITKLRSLIY